jgi:uncharacterized protein (TIGR02217 family)
MTTFIEERFPTDISFGSMGGPEFCTDIISTHGGHEYRNIRWSKPRARYNVAYGIHTDEQLARVRDFHYVMRGRAIGFRFQDPLDHTAAQSKIGLGDGTKKHFQLVKHYQLNDSDNFTREIRKPVAGSVQIYFGEDICDAAWHLDATKGEIIFGVAPVAGTKIMADFMFDVPVRFDSDHLPMRLEKHRAAQFMDIPLLEILA